MRKVEWLNELEPEQIANVEDLLERTGLKNKYTLVEFLDGIWSLYNRGYIGGRA